MASVTFTPSNYATFDASRLTLTDPKKLDNGSNQAYLNYQGKRLRVQAPQMPVPMDASDYKDNGKFKVNFSFRDRESSPKVAGYFTILEKIDNFLVDKIMEKSGPWFKKPNMSRESVLDKFTPSIRYAKDKDGNLKDYPPTHPVAIKKSYKTGGYIPEIYNKEKALIEGRTPMEILKRGSEVTPLSEVSAVWGTDKGFGLTWSLHQALVNIPAEGAEEGCGILDEDGAAAPIVSNAVDDDEEGDLMAAVKPVVAAKPAPAPAPIVDDEADEDELIEAPPVPAPKAVKKVAVKKIAK